MKPSNRCGIPALRSWIVLGLLVGLMTPFPARADTLQNDGWTFGAQVGFQSGFVAGEEGAVTLGPVSQGMLMHTVQFLFGGNTSAASVTIRIYEDVGTAEPGTMLHQETLFLTGSETLLQELDVFPSQVFIPAGGSVRVSFRFVHAGLPSIARDSDGTIQTGRNWISTPGLGWVDSQLWGLTGDFIVRALVLPATGPGPDAGVDGGISTDGGGMGDGGADPDAGANPDGGADLDAGVDPDGGADPDTGVDPDGGTDPDASVGPDAGNVPTQCLDSSGCEGGYICYRGNCLLMCLSTDECPDARVCHQGF